MAAAMDRKTLLLHALRMGAVLGAMKIALVSLAYGVFGVAALVNPATGLAMWFGVIAALIFSAWSLKQRAGGYQRFTVALAHLCLIWAVGQVLYTGFSILLFHVLAPDLLEATVEPMRAIARQLGQRAQLPPDQIEAMAAAITADTSPFSVAGQLRGFRDGLFPGIVISLVIAIPFRARPAPSEEPPAPTTPATL
jgi:hypothetical protein